MATMAQAIATLFGAYGEASDINRQEIYARVLATLPPALVEKAVLKTIAEWKSPKLPPVGVLMDNAKSLNATANERVRVKTWEEAWAEIEKAMYSTPWGKTPAWSTPQIKAAVDAFGWNNLQTSLASDMPTNRAQVRRFYEDACARIATQARNEFLLGKNPAGVLGIPRVAQNATMIKKLIDTYGQLGVGK